jgi:hypothetical protein
MHTNVGSCVEAVEQFCVSAFFTVKAYSTGMEMEESIINSVSCHCKMCGVALYMRKSLPPSTQAQWQD